MNILLYSDIRLSYIHGKYVQTATFIKELVVPYILWLRSLAVTKKTFYKSSLSKEKKKKDKINLTEFKRCIDFDFAGRLLHGFAQNKWTGGLTNITKWSNHCFLFWKSQWLSPNRVTEDPQWIWPSPLYSSCGLECKPSVESTRRSPSSLQHTSLLLLNNPKECYSLAKYAHIANK